ncbi:hypothetical protein QBC34DRAFT_441718 [Podospora aff. communis PSN243]|uniref:Uncharacterized protein n=1 Tax=Podospora aff. communis PSN243 TaxID=3040156 RepID=A0AAV9GBL7_9PEZI|nr:hypothetical protein QBC34DRAFT_441718 [Podospora aff. communis PSN243]
MAPAESKKEMTRRIETANFLKVFNRCWPEDWELPQEYRRALVRSPRETNTEGSLGSQIEGATSIYHYMSLWRRCIHDFKCRPVDIIGVSHTLTFGAIYYQDHREGTKALEMPLWSQEMVGDMAHLLRLVVWKNQPSVITTMLQFTVIARTGDIRRWIPPVPEKDRDPFLNALIGKLEAEAERPPNERRQIWDLCTEANALVSAEDKQRCTVPFKFYTWFQNISDKIEPRPGPALEDASISLLEKPYVCTASDIAWVIEAVGREEHNKNKGKHIFPDEYIFKDILLHTLLQERARKIAMAARLEPPRYFHDRCNAEGEFVLEPQALGATAEAVGKTVGGGDGPSEGGIGDNGVLTPNTADWHAGTMDLDLDIDEWLVREAGLGLDLSNCDWPS